VPFFLFNALGKKDEKKRKALYKATIAKYNLNIEQQEIWGNRFIGIDAKQNKLLFVKILPSGSTEQLLDLSPLKGCQVLEKRKVVKTKHKKDSHLEQMDLELLFKNSAPVILNFYDEEENFGENFELKRVEKWKVIVLDSIVRSHTGKAAA
tara:strand:- start:805 stop:1257 length:453 start_codon:yes stop_codon:yes gene_type:complete